MPRPLIYAPLHIHRWRGRLAQRRRLGQGHRTPSCKVHLIGFCRGRRELRRSKPMHGDACLTVFSQSRKGPFTAHSHSFVFCHRNALNSKRKFLLMTVKLRPISRQIFLLLISKRNLRDSDSARVRPLSLSIGPFARSPATTVQSNWHEKYRQPLREL